MINLQNVRTTTVSTFTARLGDFQAFGLVRLQRVATSRTTGVPTLGFVDTALGLLALLLSLVALSVAVAGRRGGRGGRSRADASGLPEDPRALRQEVAALKAENAQAMRHVAVVRYDAFTDTGGQLSWSMALLDDSGSGVVLTSIQGRNDSRSYAKNVAGWTSETQLSPEEEDAISNARP